MNEILCLMQDNAKDKEAFENWITTAGKLKSFDGKPYLVTITE